MIDYRNYKTIEDWQEALEAAGLDCSWMLVHDVKNLAEGWKVDFAEALELAVQYGLIPMLDPHTYILLQRREIKVGGNA